jgi:ATP-dependent helicase/nuclease subunit B
MSSPVELILGPARSGKASRVLAAYAEALAGAGPGRCLMLVPTARRRRESESRLLATQAAGVLIRPQVFTLHEAAERLLAAAGRTVRLIPALARRHLIRECLDRLGPREAALLGAVRDAPGLVDALDALCRELKAARVDPDAFGRALTAGLRSPRNRLLAVLYADYQRALQARDVYDEAGRFWHAADLLAKGEFGPFGNLALLAVDGFQNFDPAQLDVLEALSTRAERTILTLVYDAARPKLFGVTGRTRERLRARFGRRLREISANEPARLPAGLERIRTHLFRLPDPAGGPALAANGSVCVVRAAGRTREVEEAARRISDLVRAGAAPASVAVIAHSLDAYAALVREIFPRYGLEFRVERERRLSECPVVRAAMALVRPQADAYAFRAVARLVTSSYFRPEAFDADAETARAAVRLAREANVWEGRESYSKGLDYLKSLAARNAETADDTGEFVLKPEDARVRLDEIERVRAFLARLFNALALPAEAARSEFADGFRRILRASGLWDAVCADAEPRRRARDAKALAALEEVFEEVALLAEDGAARIPRDRFLAEVTQGLDLATAASEEPADAPVVVMDATESRALAFDHVFVLGLAEKEFPRRGRPHPFFDDAERADLRRRQVDLRDTSHDAEHEMLLYYLAVTRARRSLVLSYPSLDAQSRPALASHYLEETASLFAESEGGERLPTSDVGTRDLDVPHECHRAARDLLASTLFSLWGPGETRDAGLHFGVLEALLGRGEAAGAALAGLAVEHERERGEAFGPFDGRLAAADILEALCRRYPAEVVMSAKRLETFGGCPFAFFASDLLGLKEREEPSPDLGPLDLGLIYHGLLERFFSGLAASKTLGGRLTESNREAALAILQEKADGYFEHLESHGRIGSPALWQVQKRNILRDLARLVDWHIERLGNWRPAYVEAWFGAPPGTKVHPPGSREPIQIDGPHGPIRLRGRIDRIDLAAGNEPGYQVIDYKSGASAPSEKAMALGTSFQLPVYLWAAETLLPEAERRGDPRAFFLPIRQPAEKGRLQAKPTPKYPEGTLAPALDRAGRYIANFIEAMREGLFPVWPRSTCPEHCDFQGICRFAEWRLRRKWEAHPIAQLESIGDADSGDEEDET